MIHDYELNDYMSIVKILNMENTKIAKQIHNKTLNKILRNALMFSQIDIINKNESLHRTTKCNIN